jgi:hypothetical protein
MITIPITEEEIAAICEALLYKSTFSQWAIIETDDAPRLQEAKALRLLAEQMEARWKAAVGADGDVERVGEEED